MSDSSHFLLPPSRAKVLSSLSQFSLPPTQHILPHCSDPAYVPDKPLEALGHAVPLHHPGQVAEWPVHCTLASERDQPGQGPQGQGADSGQVSQQVAGGALVQG